jgi:putative transposase
LLVEYDEKTAISEVVRAFKGRSSRMVREEFPGLTKRKDSGHTKSSQPLAV